MRNISLIDVEYGDTKNWLRFTCYCGWIDINSKFKFDYCVTELICKNFDLLDNQKEDLRNQIDKNFGVQPFDIIKCKEKIKEIGCIQICNK